MLAFMIPRLRCVLTLLPAAALTPGAAAQWTMINLHPAGASSSYANKVHEGRIGGYGYFSNPARQSAGMWNSLAPASWVELAPPPSTSTISWVFDVGGAGGEQQGGQFVLPGGGSDSRACWWSGTAASFTDLHPTAGGFISSGVLGVTQGQQWGWVRGADYLPRATVWSGTAASRTDLHPPGAASSLLYASDGARQAGFITLINGGNIPKAAIWFGTAATCYYLHPVGAYSSTFHALDGSQLVGFYIVGASVNAERALICTLMNDGSVVADTLHPAGADASIVYDVHGGVQVGSAITNNLARACVWFGTAASREDPLPNLPLGTTQSEARGVYTTPTTITVVGFINNAQGRWNAVAWTKPNTPAPCSPADMGSAGGTPGPDGHLDNNDFVVFIDRFFTQNPAADIGATGGLPGHDGVFDNNDFVVFVDQFFAGAAAC